MKKLLLSLCIAVVASLPCAVAQAADAFEKPNEPATSEWLVQCVETLKGDPELPTLEQFTVSFTSFEKFKDGRLGGYKDFPTESGLENAIKDKHLSVLEVLQAVQNAHKKYLETEKNISFGALRECIATTVFDDLYKEVPQPVAVPANPTPDTMLAIFAQLQARPPMANPMHTLFAAQALVKAQCLCKDDLHNERRRIV